MRNTRSILLLGAATLGAGYMMAQQGPQSSLNAPLPATAGTPAQPIAAPAEGAAKPATVDTASLFDWDAPLADYRNARKRIIRHITVQGAHFLDPELIVATSGLVRGDSAYIPGPYIAQAIRRLMSQRYFSEVRVGFEPVGRDSVDLFVLLQERPRVYRWLFTGIGKGQQTDLREKLKLKAGGELSDYILERNKLLIRKYFNDKGFRHTTVTTRIENDTVVPNAVNVTFQVDRKDRVKIGKIVFEGNETFTDGRLRRTFKKTHQKGINFLRSSKLNDLEFENDKELLIDFYNSKGYRNATVLSDSIFDINPKRIGLKIDVSEGDKYYFRNIEWVGNSVYTTEALQQMLSLKRGDTYDKKTLHKRLGVGREENPEDLSIKSLYQNQGYLMSQIDPAEIIVGKDSIDLQLKVFEGKPFKINEVTITGNQHIDDEIIRRELYTRPGELYNRSLLMQTMRQLSSMQHFNPENLVPSIQPVTNSNELVDISWPLEEKASDQFNIAGGWGANTFVGSVAVTLNNLSIKNFFKKGAWRPYPQGQSQSLTLSVQSNGTYYKAAAMSFTEPWMGGKKPNALTVNLHWSEENNAYYFWQKSTQHFRAFGIAMGIGRRLNWPDPYFTLYNELSWQRYALKDWDYFVMKNGRANVISFKTVLSRNSVDQPLYPRRGSEFTLSLALTPPYSLWDKKDYSNKTMSDKERYRWIEYHKWNLKAVWYHPLSRNSNLVLMARAEMGYLGNYNKHKTSPFERFNVGGDGMSGYNIYGVDVISMRGYEDGALNPNGQYAAAYNKYTIELRYPFILKPSSTIYGLIFAEGGNAFDSWKSFSPFKIKRSLGVGVRLYLPIVGMLGIDWGYGFDRTALGQKAGSKFSFLIGQQF